MSSIAFNTAAKPSQPFQIEQQNQRIISNHIATGIFFI